MKDSDVSWNGAGGKMIINGPQGITGTPKDSTFTIGIILILMIIIVLNLINSRTDVRSWQFVMTVLQQNL